MEWEGELRDSGNRNRPTREPHQAIRSVRAGISATDSSHRVHNCPRMVRALADLSLKYSIFSL